MKTKYFNYAVGRYWKDGSSAICVYAFGNEVHFGNIKDAKSFLEYVKEQEPEEDWKIFVLKELEE